MMHLAPEYRPDELPQHLRDLAFAYLEASEHLCRDLDAGSWPATFLTGQPVLFLALHATEIFLKACIASAAPAEMKSRHPLGELLATFSSCFPGVPFEPPFGAEPIPADEVLIALAVKDDATLNQRFRYPTDSSGTPWGGVRAFSPELFLAELERLHGDFDRISAVVFKS